MSEWECNNEAASSFFLSELDEEEEEEEESEDEEEEESEDEEEEEASSPSGAVVVSSSSPALSSPPLRSGAPSSLARSSLNIRNTSWKSSFIAVLLDDSSDFIASANRLVFFTTLCFNAFTSVPLRARGAV